MAAPSFVGAGAGAVWTTGSAVAVTKTGCTTGNLVFLHIFADNTSLLVPTLSSISGVANLAGTANSWTTITTAYAPVGGGMHHYVYVGRATGSTVSTSIAHGSGDDLYARIYEFQNASAGTTLATVVENGAGSSHGTGSGTTAAVDDTGVTTTGNDRLACQFVAINDDNAMGAFTGMTGGTWAEAVAEYASATGTDGCIQLQTATIASAGTINGGSYTMSAADGWGVLGLAIKPTYYEQDITLGLLDGSRALYAPTIIPDKLIEVPLLARVSGYPLTVDDQFARTVSSPSWGNADSGGAWTARLTSGTNLTYEVSLGTGIIRVDSAADTAEAHLDLPESLTDVEVTAEGNVDGTLDGTHSIAFFFVRGIQGYRFYIQGDQASLYAIDEIGIQRYSGGSWVNVSFLSRADSSSWKMRGRVDGTALKLKVWGSTAPEPGSWDIETTDSNISAAGTVGLGGYCQTSSSYSSAAVSFAWFQVANLDDTPLPDPPALYAPTLEQTGGVSTQSITLGLLDGAAALYAPSVLAEQDISLGALENTPTLYAPTLTPKNTLALGLLDGASALYAPTLTRYNTISLGAIENTPVLYAPTLVPKNTISLGVIDAGPALYAPTLTVGPVTATLPLLESTATLYAPTLTPGPVGITLDLLDGAAALYAPDLTLAPYPITLGLLDAGAELYAPELVKVGATPQDITLGLLDAANELYAPTILPQPVTISLSLIDAGAALYAPSIIPDQFIALEILESTPALYAPTIIPAPLSITLALLDSGPQLYAPTLARDEFITLGLIDAGPALYAPTLVGKNTISLALLDGAGAVYAPTLTAKNTITLGFIDGGPTLYAPTITGGAQLVVLPVLDAGAALYPPEIQPDQFIALTVVDGLRELYAPTIIPGAVGITLGLLDGSRAVYSPTIVGKNLIVLDLIDGGRALYEPTLSGAAQQVTIGLLDASAALYAPTLTAINLLEIPALDGSRALYPPAVAKATVTIAGVTRSSNGSPLGLADVLCFRSDTNELVATTQSDSNGFYSVTVPGGRQYFLVAYSAAGVYGTTARDLEGV